MNELLRRINSRIYSPAGLKLTQWQAESESQDYGACNFRIGGSIVISRNAKITPTKVGQFVTIWKRLDQGSIQPLEEEDPFDLLVINVQHEQRLGQFVFPKSILSQRSIITNQKNEGKRGIRVYPPWDKPTSKQAINTQNWQLLYFLHAGKNPNIQKTDSLYKAISV